MSQRRLTHYFNPSRDSSIPSRCSFLDLPNSVRNLIYEFAGLDDLFVDLNYTNLKVFPEDSYPETLDCRKLIDGNGCYKLRKIGAAELNEVWEINDSEWNIKSYGRSVWGNGYGLHQSMLLVSKQIHQEVETFTYAGAVFRVCLGQPLGFTRLWRMSDLAVSNMGSLTIRLDIPNTVVRIHAWMHIGNRLTDTYTPPKHIDLSTKCGRKVMQNWTTTLERLARSLRPGQLRLRVIFRAKTKDDARAVIEPMMQLPLLKECAICVELYGESCCRRLYLERDGDPYTYYEIPRPTYIDTEISQLVRKVVRKLTVVQDPAPFRYLDLPPELRFAILEYILVSAHVVQWRPRNWVERSPPCQVCRDHGRIITDEGDSLCLPDDCLQAKLVPNIETKRCCKRCAEEDYSGICYCSTHGQIWSSSCRCQPPRHPLFSVSSQVRQDAIAVFYARNQVAVTYCGSPLFRVSSPKSIYWNDRTLLDGIPYLPRTDLSLYLSAIARNALQHIRWLEWILPSMPHDYLLPRTPAWFDHLDTLLLMENAMNMPALTFTINLAAQTESWQNYWIERVWRRFEMVILPVRQLSEAGLKDFFVHLPRCKYIEEGRRVHHEQDLERAVMGKDYNSAVRGKPVERMYRIGLWMEEQTWR